MNKKFVFFLLGISIYILPTVNAQEIKVPLHLSLAQAMAMASTQNTQIFAANERVRQALANIAVNRSALLPQLTGNLGESRQTTDLRSIGIKLPGDPHIGPFNSFDARARLTMDIFDPQAIDRLQSAKAGSKLSQAEFQKVKQDMLALVGAMFLEAHRAQESVLLYQINLKQARHQFELFRIRLKQGTASISDLNKAKVDLAQARYLLKAIESHAEQTRLDLASALKIPLDQPIIFDGDESWLHKELQQADVSPDVAVAEAQVLESHSEVREAKAGFWPKISASGDYGRLGGSPSAASNTYDLGVIVVLPIWEGGLKQAQLDEAKSKVKEDEALLEDAKDQNNIKIKEAKDNLDQAKAFLMAKLQQVYYARHQWTVAISRLRSGLGSRVEMDEADTLNALAIDDKNEAQALYWTARINLAHAIGNVEGLFK